MAILLGWVTWPEFLRKGSGPEGLAVAAGDPQHTDQFLCVDSWLQLVIWPPPPRLGEPLS